MELSVIDRIVLLDILPTSGTFLTVKIVRQLRDALYFDEAELVEYGLEQKGEQFVWQTSTAVEVEIGPKAAEIIRAALLAMDDDEKITDREFSLYERFVEADGECQSQ